MFGIHVSEGTAEGWFGRGKASAVASLAIIFALIFGIAFGVFAAVSGGGDVVPLPSAPSIPSAPTAPTPVAPAVPTTTPAAEPGLIEITAEKLVSDLLVNPDKYSKGTIFQVSGILKWGWKTDLSSSQYTMFFFGPPVYVKDANKNIGVYARVYWAEKENILAFRDLNDEDRVVFKGTYSYFSEKQGVSLDNCSLISITPAK